MKKKLILISLAVAAVLLVRPMLASAQILEPVKCVPSLVKTDDSNAELRFATTIDDGWHVYSYGLGNSGPIEATVVFDKLKGAEAGKLTHVSGAEEEQYDEMFGMVLRFFEHEVTFAVPLTITADDYAVSGHLQYGACNNQNCLPPTNVPFEFGATDTAGDETGITTTEGGLTQLPPTWAPVHDEAIREDASPKDASLWKIFLSGIVAGLIALVTPCVWPIIPMTVSFFLKRSESKRKGRRDAYIYGASIVVIYVLLGLIITLLFGASALNKLSTAAVPNLFFFALLVVFGLSFLGAFEITLPSKWSTSIDAKSEKTGGLFGIFLMAFTLALVSFSCTGPIIGFLLVEVSTLGNILGPLVGMLGFAIALALPFTLFAIFPAWLKSTPRSGGWMNTVKVVLAFIELAFSLKFLSVADLAYGWGILSRPTFLCLWIVLAALLGCYLLGWIRFPHDEPKTHTSIPAFLLALVSFAFALYMVPGLWGAPCKAVSAFAPPMSTQDFNLADNTVHAQFDDFDQGMQFARQHNKPVMIDFSGYGCVNCRKMEQSVLSDERVASVVNNDYVLITLIVDDKTALPEPMYVTENGKQVKLSSVGDKWSFLQRYKFGANAQPFYVLLDGEGNSLAGSRSYDEDVPAFLEFLNKGLEKY
ncbi:MAG: thioredoxin family protein [Bacteroidaceae bacterium]|nr:thioredoxin family protein [Bacteroidaceae bacterium]